jgi:hypothetical protein
VLTQVREQPKLVDPVVATLETEQAIAAEAHAFLTGISVGAKAYDGGA